MALIGLTTRVIMKQNIYNCMLHTYLLIKLYQTLYDYVCIFLKTELILNRKQPFNVEMSESTIKALNYLVEDVGKHLKSSKKRYLWKFSLSGNNHTLTLDTSIITGKIRLAIDGKVLVSSDLVNNVSFQHHFKVDDYSLVILQQATDFQLRINNQTFIHLLGQEKTNSHFKSQEEALENDNQPTMNFSKGNSNKITLNIGTVGNGMKKKRNVESQNWKELGGEDIEYFKKIQEARCQIYCKINDSLPEQQKGDQQVIAQKFNTMQQLFATVNPNTPNTPPTQDFNTMQQLFSTVNPNSSQSQNVQKQGNAINLMENFNTMQQLFSTVNPSVEPISQEKPKNAVNLMEDFNTMQQMFSTNLNQQALKPNENKANQPQNQQFSTMQQLFSTQVPAQVPSQIPAQKTQQFSTMQQLFQTLQLEQPRQQAKNQNSPSNQQVPDFNTMQNMFQTINKMPNSPMPNNQNQLPNIQDFSTMQMLFQTQNNSDQPMKPVIPNSNDFNTMQNLFNTTNQPPQYTQNMQNQQNTNPNINNVGALKKQDNQGEAGSMQVKNLQKLNMNDFNTMQNLFKTMNPQMTE